MMNNNRNSINYIKEMLRFNFRIVFGGKFLWFILASLSLYLLVASVGVYNGAIPTEGFVYGITTLPALLIIFYPMTFGIQNDLDTGILETLFGIPNYRYKVWLGRLVMIFAIVFFLLIFFAMLSNYLLTQVPLFEISLQLMFPVMFVGMLAFWLSTLIKNGNGTAVVVVVISVFLFILSERLEGTMWDVFLSPFEMPNSVSSEILWDTIVLKNRAFLSISTILFLLLSLFNLQKREGYI